MSQEPPAGYVAFVARHLEPLRRDAALITGDEADAGDVYTPALTDVAARWRRFEFMNRFDPASDRPHPAEAYLERAVARRSAGWHEQTDDNEPHIEVWSADRAPPPPVPLNPDAAQYRRTGKAARRVSAAVRIANARPTPLATASAVAEAAIAWVHAYEAHLRHRRIAGGAAALLGLLLIYGLQLRLNT
jgi:hypothetical protein